MKKVIKEFMNKHGKSESGFTMAEILVAIGLLAIVTVVVTSTIINATNTSDKFSRGTMHESELLNAVSLITRDISLAQEITYAGEEALSVKTVEKNSPSDVRYFYWEGQGSEAKIPSAESFQEVKANASKLPVQPGIVEYRVVNGDTANPTIRMLIEGYNSGNAEFPLFSYFDTDNKEILLDATTPPAVSEGKLKEIRRIEIHFTSLIDDRNNAMELKTSASPRFLGKTIDSVAGAEDLNRTQAPILYGDLTPRTNVAKLWWTPIAGADSYTLYRTNRLQSPNLTQVVATPAGSASTYDDTTVQWGETYDYYIVANGYAGMSDASNSVRLRVTPAPTEFVNIDPTRGQDGSPIAGYTVARNLTNQLSWAPSAGEDIKYRLYTVSGTTKTLLYDGPLLTYAHTGRAYGDVTTYVVAAYNDTIPSYNNTANTVTGGQSVDSPPVTLYSPPVRPTITGLATNDLTATKTTSPTNNVSVTNDSTNPNAQGYTFHSGSSSTSITTQRYTGVNTSYSHTVGWGTTTHYTATAYNAAGNSPVSAPIALNQHPGPFSITSLANNIGYAYVTVRDDQIDSLTTTKKNGQMTADWTTSSGATGYNVNRDVSNFLSGNVMSLSTMNYESDNIISGGTTTVTTFNNVHPGVIYRVDVIAKASNGLTRTVDATLLSKPDVPRSGILESMCLADGTDGSAQTLAMYVEANTYPKYGRSSGTTVSFYKAGSTGAAPYNTALGTEVFAWQRMNFNQEAGITFQNYIASDIVGNASADFGISSAERKSYPLELSTIALSAYNGACNTYTGGTEIPKAGTLNGYPWVVPIYVCYGYQPGHDYGQYWHNPSDPRAGGRTYADRLAGDVQNTGGGCAWRYHPYTGTDPRWYSR